MSGIPYADLSALAAQFRSELEIKKYILLYAHNGTGKTRLSTAFKDIGKQAGQADTLYFNAYTEDLFSWHNDLDGDSERYLVLHPSSSYFAGLDELEMDNRIRPLLRRYAMTTRTEPLVKSRSFAFLAMYSSMALSPRSTTSRFHAAKRIYLSGAFSSQSCSLPWMTTGQGHTIGSSTFTSMILFHPSMSTTP
jgi:hypothetical protein